MDLPVRQLGRYHLLRLLGFGGMGEVYLASSKGAAGFEKLVTVKLLRRQVSQNPDREPGPIDVSTSQTTL